MADTGPGPRFRSLLPRCSLKLSFASVLSSMILAGAILAPQIFVVPIWAQNSDPVQMVARADLAKANPARETSVDGGAPGRSASFRVDVDLVLVPVTVTDNFSRPILGLKKESFELLDDEKEQRIRFLSQEDQPLSVALVLDVSESMSNTISVERAALGRFFENANPEDEYFAIGVSSRPTLLSDSTQHIGDIQEQLASTRPEGYTALLDGICMALNKLKSARYQRRVVLIISDGGENHSRFKYEETKELAVESDVLVYAIRPVDAAPVIRELGAKLGNRLLSGITEATGGRTVLLSSNDNIPGAAAMISKEIRTQYVLGYRPLQKARDGKVHKIKIRTLKLNDKASLRLHYRKQYSAPGS